MTDKKHGPDVFKHEAQRGQLGENLGGRFVVHRTLLIEGNRPVGDLAARSFVVLRRLMIADNKPPVFFTKGGRVNG